MDGGKQTPTPSHMAHLIPKCNPGTAGIKQKPSRKITNLDLEMAGLLMHWLVLENIADLQHTHIATRCDNTPTVAWTTWLLATKAPMATHLICALALCMLVCQASPLTMFHLPGKTNCMADIASCSLKTFPNEKRS